MGVSRNQEQVLGSISGGICVAVGNKRIQEKYSLFDRLEQVIGSGLLNDWSFMELYIEW